MKRHSQSGCDKNDPLHVVMFSAEATPFVKVGGLADVLGALPKVLEKQGAKLTLVIPAYKVIDRIKYNVRPCGSIPGFDVPMGSSGMRAGISQTRVKGTGIDVYLVGNDKYFDRDGIYDDPVTKEGHVDNMERFIFFMKAGIELLEKLGQRVDIIHCHDSQTALIPGLIQVNLRSNPFFARTGTLFTIHNLAYQGVYPKEALYWAGIDEGHFYPTSSFEYWGKVNFMKVGIEFADKINTVSETYAAEIQSSAEFGYGLEGVLQNRKDDVSGIVNGIDYEEWNPASDPLIPAHFSTDNLSGKARCKEALLQRFGLPSPGSRVPLIGIISRLADQKGFDLIAEAGEELAGLNLKLVVLGTGQQKYHELFQKLASRYPEKIGVHLGFDNQLAHMIEAGCDMFLMPSKYEPCGLNQLYSLKYGTVPVVRATGGLADTVVDYDSGHDRGTGFCFTGYFSSEMMSAIKRALTAYSEPERWHRIMVRAMTQDWSWSRSANVYMRLYRSIWKKRNSEGSDTTG